MKTNAETELGKEDKSQPKKIDAEECQPGRKRENEALEEWVLLESLKEIPLSRAANPYQVRRSGNLSETEQLLRHVRFIANKLTPENASKLVDELKQLPISTEHELRGCVEIIYESSVDDQRYIETYANLCQSLRELNVARCEKENISFINVFYTRCQNEFESDLYKQINYEKSKQCKNDEKKRELENLAEEKLSKAKRRWMNNLLLIGELNKSGENVDSVIDFIEKTLAKANDEFYLACVCRLLASIGQHLDNLIYEKVARFYERLREISSAVKVANRVRFMIMDLMDLRNGSWKPRRIEERPHLIAKFPILNK